MKFQLKKAETRVILTVFIQDSSSTTGAGLAGLIHTSGITGGYIKRNGTGVALAVDEDVAVEGTYAAPTTAAQVRIGTPANQIAGVYELHFHNDLFTTADYVTIGLGGAANMAPLLIEIQLTDIDFNDGVRAALTALPNAAADAAGGLPISDVGGLDMDAILADTNEIQGKLPTNKMMGSSDGADDDGNINSILTGTVTNAQGADVASDVAAAIGTDNKCLISTDAQDLSGTLDVNTKTITAGAVTEIWAKAMSDLDTGAPSATASALDALNWLYEAFRNKTETTATRITIYKDDKSTELARATISDDATTFTKDEMETGV